ncbi:hypothetical protein AB4099_12465 [Bosea sp. 2KB_26]|uniref:hypothetical protein n=1 Tax=Bosea sp. 2KB_26 TaxID=3237475 RepID=UPI003F91CFD4
MADARVWMIVDDQLRDAETFAASFERAFPVEGYVWKAAQAADAQNDLLRGNRQDIAGVFVDVDLSSDGKVIGTGLGLAQNVRARQKNKKEKVPDYPIFRFANPDPVREYIGDDPASDDLFDLLVSKDYARGNLRAVAEQATAVRSVYDGLSASPPADLAQFAQACGLDFDQFEVWGDVRLWQKLRLGLADTSTTHVAAGTFVRTFLLPEGLLVGEEVMAVRMGIDRANSPGWPIIRDSLAGAKYNGLGANGFTRWWARGINAYWLTHDQDEYLHQRTSRERVEKLRAATGAELVHLEPSAAYWRLCALSRRRGELRPIDPARALTLLQRVPQDPWIDPEQAAPDVAAMMRGDARVDPDELARVIR